MEIRTVYDLKYEYQKRHPSGHFFDHDTLKFFGERLSEMYLYKAKSKVKDTMGEEHLCYCLRSTQRPPFGGKRSAYHYFDAETLDQIIR